MNHSSARILVIVGLAVGLGWSLKTLPQRTLADGTAPVTQLNDAIRAAGFSFDPVASQYERQAFETAVASARPEARRLIEAVDGLTRVRFGSTGHSALGMTTSDRSGIAVVIDLGTVQQRYGPRGIARVVLHELGHVIDFSVLDDPLRAKLDAGIPRGYACQPGEPTGSCATREERFAESFAKWAMNDIGVDLYIGYKVPPPSMPLEDWGRPLAALAV